MGLYEDTKALISASLEQTMDNGTALTELKQQVDNAVVDLSSSQMAVDAQLAALASLVQDLQTSVDELKLSLSTPVPVGPEPEPEPEPTPDPDPEPVPEPDPTPEPAPDVSVTELVVADLDHVYPQLRVWNDSMTKILLKNSSYEYFVLDFPSLANKRKIDALGSDWRWYGDKLYGVTETGVVDEDGYICKLADGDTVSMGRSYEDIDAGKLALLTDNKDKVYIADVINHSITSFSLPPDQRNIDTVLVMPKGDSVFINFNGDGTGLGKGMWLYGLDGTPLKNIADHHNHFDTGIDPDGREFLVAEEYGNNQVIRKRYVDGEVLTQHDLGDWNFWHVSSRAYHTKRIAVTSGPFYDANDKKVTIVDGDEVIAEFDHQQPKGITYELQPQATISQDGKWVCFDSGTGAKFMKID